MSRELKKSKNGKGDLKLFKNEELICNARINQDGVVEFLIDDVAKGLGFVQIQNKNGKQYTSIRFVTVNKYLTEFGFPNEMGKGDLIPEQYVYLLAMKANNELAIKFQRWLAFNVIPSLRKHDAYVGANADEEYVNDEMKFGTAQRVRKTFAYSHDLFKDYDEFVLYSRKNLDVAKRNTRLKQIVNTLSDRENKLYANKVRGYKAERETIIELKELIHKDIIKINNRSTGHIEAHLKRKLAYQKVDIDDCVQFDIHPFSLNYMYEHDGLSGTRRTEAYNKWIQNFPVEEIKYLLRGGVDLTKDIEMFLYYVCLDKFDCDNFTKSTQDMVFNRGLNIDDKIVKSVHVKIVENCNSYSDGKIYCYIRNLEKQLY